MRQEWRALRTPSTARPTPGAARTGSWWTGSGRWVPCGGKKPRFFAIEPGGNYLFNGNQSSDTITLFRIDAETGALVDTGKVLDTPTPVWMLFTDSVPSVEQFGSER